MKLKIVLIWLIALAAFWEGACYSALWFLKRFGPVAYAPLQEDALDSAQRDVLEKLLEGRSQYLSHDPELGWTIKQNGMTDLFRANSAGLRGDKEYSEALPDGSIRIATFGDSITHGDEVLNAHTWQVQLERYDPRFEVLNFGVGGYGPEQPYLRYRNVGKKFQPRLVLIGFISENIYRSMNVFRPFYMHNTGLPLSKPKFVLQEGKLVLLPNLLADLQQYRKLLDETGPMLKQLGTYDWFYQHRYRSGRFDFLPSVRLFKILLYQFQENEEFVYHPRSEAFQLSLTVLTEFANEVRSDFAKPVIVLFPGVVDLQRAIRGRPVLYRPLIDALRERNVPVVDLIKAFECELNALKVDGLFEAHGHYSKEGNRLVAKYLYRVVREAFSEEVSSPDELPTMSGCSEMQPHHAAGQHLSGTRLKSNAPSPSPATQDIPTSSNRG